MTGQEIKVVRAVIIKKNTSDPEVQHVLLHQRPQITKDTIQPHRWQMPGGRKKENETTTNAILRKLQEELGFSEQHFTIFEQIKGVFGNTEWPYHAFLILLSDQATFDPNVSIHAQQSRLIPLEKIEHIEIAFDHEAVITQGLLQLNETDSFSI